jgi:hypothetical protein
MGSALAPHCFRRDIARPSGTGQQKRQEAIQAFIVNHMERLQKANSCFAGAKQEITSARLDSRPLQAVS